MLLVVGWDGASLELANRFRADGRMPVLDSLIARGRTWRVSSTIPAVTFPAWTSFLTGAMPDRHGVTDFTIPRDGTYGFRFANASDRRMPTVLARMAAAGRRVGMYGVPATFPPEGQAVFEICGFDTPLGSSRTRRATHPPALADEIRARHGRLGIEGIPQGRIDGDWHRDTHQRLLGDIRLRTRIALELLAASALDVFVVHYMESDTVSHHFWHFDDAASPRHAAGPREAIGDVYAALDDALGELVRAAGPDANVLVLSDHGSAGASDRIVFWNRWLADCGLLAFRDGGGESLAARVKRTALAVIPRSLHARAFAAAGTIADRIESRARFANVDWSKTEVYSDELPYFPSLRLNLEGREPGGIVAPSDAERILERVTRELLDARDPIDGGPVTVKVRRREELFDGPFASRYPDLVLELRRPGSYAYAAGPSRGGIEREWLRRMRGSEASGAKGTSTSGVHSPYGMAVLAGPGTPAADSPHAAAVAAECTLADLGVTVCALAGVEPSAEMQGRSLVSTKALEPVVSDAMPGLPGLFEYDDEQEHEVRERLRALGYLS
ncbi:MAG TPA: alkaline phosphatase family protein [Candidatus Limnocylindrales bacterium]|nr:alkaline phosphatase family protein [Candidatus Limnocylindrales bacterium]